MGIALGIIGSNLMDAQEKAVSKTREMTQVKVLSVFGGGVSGTRSSNESNYNEANNPPEDNTDDKDDDDAFTAPPSCMGFVLHAIPLLTVLFGLAYSMGQWLTGEYHTLLFFISSPKGLQNANFVLITHSHKFCNYLQSSPTLSWKAARRGFARKWALAN